jgi:hypothetical protein
MEGLGRWVTDALGVLLTVFSVSRYLCWQPGLEQFCSLDMAKAQLF